MSRILFYKKIFLLFLVFFCCQYSGAGAGDIFVVQSAKFPVYNEALQGLESVVQSDISAHGQKSILPHTITTHILSEEKDPQGLLQVISRKKPELIVVIGSRSLSLVKGIIETPIIYFMVPNPEPLIGEGRDNVTGINMNLTAGQQLGPVVQAIPAVRRIGMLYDPANTAPLLRDAEDFAERHNIEIVSQSIKNPREVSGRLAILKDNIDCFWMVPDPTVITPETLERIFLFSLENRIPVITFAEKYLRLGAVLSVSFDAVDIGRQAGEMALAILNNKRPADLSQVQVRKVDVRVNHMAARTLGIDVRE